MIKNSRVLQYLKDPMAILARLENQFQLYAAYHEEKDPPDKLKADENRYWADQAGTAIRDLSNLQILCTFEGFRDLGEEPCPTNEKTSTASSTTQLRESKFENLLWGLSDLELNYLNQRIMTLLKERYESQQSKEQ